MQENLSAVAQEFEGVILPGELHDVLACLKTIKDNGGVGSLRLVVRDGAINETDTRVGKEPAATPRVQVERFPVCVYLSALLRRNRLNWMRFSALRGDTKG